MKRGEKNAFLWISIGVATIAAITITLEVQHQESLIVKASTDIIKTPTQQSRKSNR